VTTNVSAAVPANRRPPSPGRALLFGTLVVGILDITDALVFDGAEGATPTRTFQGIAGEVLGHASLQGGLATVALGVALHFFISCCVAAAHLVASRRLGVLTLAHTLLVGIPAALFARAAAPREALGAG